MLLMSSLFITDLSALSASSRALPSLQHAGESRGEMTDSTGLGPVGGPEPPAAGTRRGAPGRARERTRLLYTSGPVYDQTVSSEPEPRKRRCFLQKRVSE